MQRLTGLDASFLYLETPSSHMHVAGLMILDPSEVEGGVDLDRVKEVYGQRLHLAPPFRRRLAEVPLGLHHPLWIEDPDFDLDFHIRSTALPSPGTREQLSTLVGRLSAIPLDRTRPLWEVWVIEGLEDGHVAVLSKVHHAAIDGASGNEMTVALLDLTPEIAQHEPPEEWQPDRVPSDPELLGYAATSLIRQPVRVARALGKTAAGALAVRRRNRQVPNLDPPPSPFSAPRTSFNTAITPRRSFAFTSVSLPEVKAVKNATGATVNDVVLALCAGALRSYLDSQDERPDGPLVAMVPVSVRADEVKEQQKALGADTLGDWAEFAAPAIAGLAARLYTRTKMADRHRPLFNVTISNIPGPPFPLYSIGARMVANYPVGPIMDGGGLNMTVMSYLDQLDFGLQACPDVLPDIWSLADALPAALDELVKATGVTPTQVKKLARSA
jgi:diacylglycerol O-acyltransferase